jgi:hypothetical protein
VGLGVLAPVRNRVEQLRIEARQAGEVLGIHFIGLFLVGVDQPQFAGVGHQYLVAALLQNPACPGRMGTSFYGDAQRGLGSEASSEGLGGGTQPAFLDDLAALLIDHAQVGVFVA